jgi:hypothetical protein
MYIFCKTNNPRPTFHRDMTQDERNTMQRHVAYWKRFADAGTAIVFGPVMDPNGVYVRNADQKRDGPSRRTSQTAQLLEPAGDPVPIRERLAHHQSTSRSNDLRPGNADTARRNRTASAVDRSRPSDRVHVCAAYPRCARLHVTKGTLHANHPSIHIPR